MTCKLTSGTLGLPGAMYKLDMTDEQHNVSASFVLQDKLGMVLEEASGAFSGTSYEFAMPFLAIMEGSIQLDGVTTQLGGGNLWLDRQTTTISTIGDQQSLSQEQMMAIALTTRVGSPLYIGDWLAIVMNDGTVYQVTFFWPKAEKPGQQWKVGSELVPPVNPTHKSALEFPTMSTWDQKSPVQGIKVLGQLKFDLNILNPKDPSQSPHWKSPSTGHTYCTAWHLEIRDKVYKMEAFIPRSEALFPGNTGFFEGAATLSDENDKIVGHAFIEQMGFN